MDLATVSGAGGTIELGGRLLTLRQLRIGDIGEMQAWMKERVIRPMQKAIQDLKDLAPLKEIDPEAYQKCRDEILLEARRADKAGEPADPQQSLDLASGLDGVAYMLYLSVRSNHPEISYEWVRNALFDEDISTVQAKLDSINQEWAKHMPKKVASPGV
jgi:hypothetical protein